MKELRQAIDRLTDLAFKLDPKKHEEFSKDLILVLSIAQDQIKHGGRRAGDRLAYAVAKCIERGALNSRSGPADALLDYLEIGSTGGPQSVPEWVAAYEAHEQKTNSGY